MPATKVYSIDAACDMCGAALEPRPFSNGPEPPLTGMLGGTSAVGNGFETPPPAFAGMLGRMAVVMVMLLDGSGRGASLPLPSFIPTTGVGSGAVTKVSPGRRPGLTVMTGGTSGVSLLGGP